MLLAALGGILVTMAVLLSIVAPAPNEDRIWTMFGLGAGCLFLALVMAGTR